MRIPFVTLAKAALFSSVLLITPGKVMAQSLWLPPTDESSVTIEALKPDMYSDHIKLTSSVWFLSGQYRVSSRFTAVVELPAVYYRVPVRGST